MLFNHHQKPNKLVYYAQQNGFFQHFAKVDAKKTIKIINCKKFVLASLSDKDAINSLQEISHQQIKLKKVIGSKENKKISETFYQNEKTVIENNQETDVSLSLSEISLKNYCKPVIYAIENKINNTVYVGETEHLLYRLGRQYAFLECNHRTSIFLQKSWNEYKAKNFTFTILESGEDHLQSKRNRIYYQNRYIVEYVAQGKNMYNVITSDQTLNQVINVIKNVKRREHSVLHPINKNVDFLFQPGIYSFKNLDNHKRYIGESNNFTVRLMYQMTALNAGSFHDQPEFQEDWRFNKKENFEISVLEYGSKFNLKKTRMTYETAYIHHYRTKVYNTLKNVNESIEQGAWKRGHCNSVSIYRKIDNDYIFYLSISKALKDTGISEPMLRNYLDDPGNSDWFYSRSYGRYSGSGRIKLLVINLNLYLASCYEIIPYSTLKKWLLVPPLND